MLLQIKRGMRRQRRNRENTERVKRGIERNVFQSEGTGRNLSACVRMERKEKKEVGCRLQNKTRDKDED